jgi:hypothetical protein
MGSLKEKNERNRTIFIKLKIFLKISYYSWTKKTGWYLVG